MLKRALDAYSVHLLFGRVTCPFGPQVHVCRVGTRMSISRKTCAVHEMSSLTQRSLFGGSTDRVMESGTFLLLGQDLDPAGLPG